MYYKLEIVANQAFNNYPFVVRTNFHMAKIEDLQDNYAKLDKTVECSDESKIDANCLLTFDYEYPNNDAEVKIDTDEFTAVCPWTGLPDFGTVTITYIPKTQCIELKSLKFYLMSYSGVGIVS